MILQIKIDESFITDYLIQADLETMSDIISTPDAMIDYIIENNIDGNGELTIINWKESRNIIKKQILEFVNKTLEGNDN